MFYLQQEIPSINGEERHDRVSLILFESESLDEVINHFVEHVLLGVAKEQLTITETIIKFNTGEGWKPKI